MVFHTGLLASILVVPALAATPLDIIALNLAAIENAVATATISTFPQGTSSLAKAFAQPTDLLGSAISLVENGFDPNDIQGIVEGFSSEENSVNNVNSREPSRPIYPKALPSDAPYSIPEQSLRGGIYIPLTFTYGKKPPVILFPGTAVPGGMTYAYTYGRLLANTSVADPLWVNIPRNSLDDAQVTAEYAAYAMNYIQGITNRNVSIITFSQGSLNVQWALKYWPSTRAITNNFIALSPDYHGTVNAELVCPPGSPIPGCTPGVLQQYYKSTFVTTLRNNGGDSAYIPTTNVRSATDEIVQPQTGPGASGVLSDARGVGVTNVLVQAACPLTPAGTLVTHEGMIYNSLAYALALDALTHGGPGRLSRLDNLPKICSGFVAPGESLSDLLAVESTFVIFFANFLTYLPRTTVEAPIKSYAT